MRALFRDRDARLLLVGQGLSLFGDRAMYLVLGIWVKTLTGSNTQAGLVFFVLALPGLVAPAFGLLVDRVRKRPLMIATDVGIALVLAALLLVHDRGDVWIVYVVTLLYVTPDELEAIGEALVDLVEPYVERVAPERRPQGSSPVQVLAVGFPIRPTATGN